MKKNPSGVVAFERLKSLLSDEKLKLDEDTISAIRTDIGKIILKYVDIEPENVDIKIILKEYNKKQIC